MGKKLLYSHSPHPPPPPIQGRIQDFKLWGAHLKKLRRAEGGVKIFGVFRVKNHGFTPKIHIFSNFKGAPPPPGSAPGSLFHIP